jgi:hypothetical protein
MSDDFNHILANQTVQALWVKHSCADERRRQRNAAVAGLVGIGPKDELEGMLATQLIACHHASMECFRRAMIGEQTFEGRQDSLNQASKLSRTYATLLEALNRHRGKGAQKVTVEHVHVHEGGQAIVGNVSQSGGGVPTKSEDQPMHPKTDPSPMHRAPRCRARSKRNGKPCQSPAVRGKAVCRMHGAGGGAPAGNRNARKHGRYGRDAMEARRIIAELIRQGRELAQIT